MPAYNAERYIALAIDSILHQTFSEFEFIIVDDASTDATPEIIRRFAAQDERITTFRNETNQNLCVTLNRALDAASGEYVARMDADDWSYPDRLQKQVAFMDVNPDVVISGGSMVVCDEELEEKNVRRYHLTDSEIRRKLFRYSPFSHPTIIFRTEAARRVNGFDPALFSAEDYDFYFRIGTQGLFANLNDTLVKLRTHSGSISQRLATRQERLTIAIRFKARAEYGYRMSRTDFAYTLLQYASSFVMPANAKFWLFNRLRRRELGKP